MSASEKLKALAEKGGRSGLDATWSDDARLYRVLPQIVAVVELADNNGDGHHREGRMADCPLCQALVALDEALS